MSDDENSPLIGGHVDSSYVGTNSDNHSPEDIKLTRKRTIRVLYFTMFIGSISFSIVMASLWPFLRKLDPTVSETYLGWVNSAYSFAQMISSVAMGYWCQKRNAKEPIYLSILLLAVGSILYSYAEAFESKGIYVILGGRLILGLNAGVTAVARSVGAQLSTNDERAKVMATLSLWQAAGFFVGPALQALTKPIGSEGLEIKSIKLYLNIYTAPGYLMVILSIVNFFVVFFFFVEDIGNTKVEFQSRLNKLRRQSTSFEAIDTPVIFICLILWFVALTIFSLNETIITPLVMNEYAWSRDKTVFYTSILLSVAGVLGIICFLCVAALEKKFGLRPVLFASYVIMLVGFIIYLPWGPGYPKVTTAMITFPNGTVASYTHHKGGGCPHTYDWCLNTPKLAIWQFLTGATLVGIGYPIAAVFLSILYSKIIGPFPQGKYMGWLTGVGSLARVIGPLYVTAVYEKGGVRWTSTSIDALLVLTLILIVAFWRRLVPYAERFRSRSHLIANA